MLLILFLLGIGAFALSWVLGALYLVLLAILPFFLIWLAEANILFTTVREGTAKAIMRGESFSHFLMALDGHHLNDPRRPWYDSTKPKWEVLKNAQGATYDDRSILIRFLGLYFVGIPGIFSVFSYSFQWNEMRKDAEGHNVLWSRNERTDFIYVVSFPYAEVAKDAETSEGIPVKGLYQQTVRVNNPYKALFETENWLEQVAGASNRRARNYIGGRSYEDLISETHDPNVEAHTTSEPLVEETASTPDGIDKDSFSCPITMLSDELPDDPKLKQGQDVPERRGLKGRYGVTIETADLLEIEITGPTRDELIKASTQKYTAEKRAADTRITAAAEADAITAKGKAEADVIELKGKAQAAAFRSRIEAIAENQGIGTLLAQVDVMGIQGENRTVIWANSPFLNQLGVDKLFESAGIKTPAQARAAIADAQNGEHA